MSNITPSLQQAYNQDQDRIINVYLVVKDGTNPEIDGFFKERDAFGADIWIGKFNLSKLPQLKENKDVIRVFVL